MGYKFFLFICKKRAAVYTTTAPNNANLFIVILPTIIHTLINTPLGAFQQPLRQSQHSTSRHVDRNRQQDDPRHYPP